MRGKLLSIIGFFSLGLFAQSADLEVGLIAYFPFSGNSNDASESNLASVNVGASLTDDKFGNRNCAYFFDGVNDHIAIKNMGSKFPEYTATVAFWAKASSFKSHNVYFLNTNSQSNRISGEVMYNHNGVNVCFFDHGNISSGRLSYYQTFDRNWHHYTYVSDFGNNEMKLYIDGVLLQRTAKSAIFNNVNNVDMWIGGGIYNGAAGLFFHGSIDEFRIYNRVLTNEEIKLLQSVNRCSWSSDTVQNSGTWPCGYGGFKVAPNPALNQFKVIGNTNCIAKGTAELYDYLGRKLITVSFVDNEAVFRVEDLAAAMYFVRIKDDSGLVIVDKKQIIGI